MTEYLREQRHDLGYRIDVWHVPPPALGLPYRVVEETWNEDVTPPERHIFRWLLLVESTTR